MAETPAPVHRRTPTRALFVAGRGSGTKDGLHRWSHGDDGWRGTQLASVADLASLAMHPSLPVVYGVSGAGEGGCIHAWDVTGGRGAVLNEIESGGAEPCHVAVDPSGRMLVVTNYASSSLAVQKLAADGSFDGALGLILLSGGSVDPERQDDAHPHQAVFEGDRLFVVDLGADLLREYKMDLTGERTGALVPVRETPVPAGTGPRHLVKLPGGRFALSGELASTLILGLPGIAARDWALAPSTAQTGPVQTRHPRNYPGDIQASADGLLVYVANRGYDTISVFEVAGEAPRLLAELDSGVVWPQHLLVWGDELLVAGWDSSTVMAMPLVDGVPGVARLLFDCAGAGWLLADSTAPER